MPCVCPQPAPNFLTCNKIVNDPKLFLKYYTSELNNQLKIFKIMCVFICMYFTIDKTFRIMIIIIFGMFSLKIGETNYIYINYFNIYIYIKWNIFSL